MKLQRSTLALVAGALILGTVVLVTESRERLRSTEIQGEEATPVYGFEETDVVGLHIETTTSEVTFSRDDNGFWQMTNPETHPAEEAAIAFLLSRLNTDGLITTIPADAANQADFGLDVPYATVSIRLQDDTLHQLVLGNTDFSGQNAYALVDPDSVPLSDEAGEITVALVSSGILSGVDRPLDEWKAVVESDADTNADTTGEPEAVESETLPPEDEALPPLEEATESEPEPDGEPAPPETDTPPEQ